MMNSRIIHMCNYSYATVSYLISSNTIANGNKLTHSSTVSNNISIDNKLLLTTLPYHPTPYVSKTAPLIKNLPIALPPYR